MSEEVWRPILTCAAIGGIAGLVGWIVVNVVMRVGRRHQVETLVAFHARCTKAWVATVVALAVYVALQGFDVSGAWDHAVSIVVIAAVSWLVVRGLSVAELAVFTKLRVDIADNRRMRRARTQVSLLRRVGSVVVVVLGLAAVLISFPALRTFGTSLLASAGVAGVVAGLAAQTTLGNVIAGLQLAFTDALRIDDVVVVEEEWGNIEEITLTYVVVRVWDERRLVLPTSYFTTTPFQNWTRNYSRVLGSVILHLDYDTPVAELRKFVEGVVRESPLWDQRDWVLQVTDTTETTMVVRILASAHDGPSAWDLRCDIREAVLDWLRVNHPQSLPTQRVATAPGHPGDDVPLGLVPLRAVGAADVSGAART